MANDAIYMLKLLRRQHSIKSSRAYSRVQVWNSSNVSGTDCSAIFRMLLMAWSCTTPRYDVINLISQQPMYPEMESDFHEFRLLMRNFPMASIYVGRSLISGPITNDTAHWISAHQKLTTLSRWFTVTVDPVSSAGSQNYDKRLLASSGPSARMEQLWNNWTDFHDIWYLRLFFENPSRYFTCN
jgi:hypothetical protein